MKTKKVLSLLSAEVNEKVFNNTIKEFGSDTLGTLFYKWKLKQNFDKHGLCGFFVYDRTPEGSKYWNELNDALVKVILTK